MTAISVIIPAYDAARFLSEAVESVLRQTLPAAEVIVVDDGSSDATAEVARGFGETLRYLHQTNAGLGAARNRGVEASVGELLAFLDADDVWPPESLAVRLAALGADDNLDAVFGAVVQFKHGEGDAVVETVAEPGLFASSMLIRREAFRRVGPFATHWTLGEFLDWYLRAVEGGLRVAMLPEVVLRRRIHGANMGVQKRHARGDYLRILKASIDRRRARERSR
jgi:glycosyltransferase involved in cell wall biosynthesis